MFFVEMLEVYHRHHSKLEIMLNSVKCHRP